MKLYSCTAPDASAAREVWARDVLDAVHRLFEGTPQLSAQIEPDSAEVQVGTGCFVVREKENP